MSNNDHPTMCSNDERKPSRGVIIDLADSIGEQHIRAMARTLARILVARALMEHGIIPANDNK